MEVVSAPVDGRIGLCEPRFSEDKIVFLEVIYDRVKVVRIFVAGKGNGGSVRGDGRRAVGKNNRNGLARMKRNGVAIHE